MTLRKLRVFVQHLPPDSAVHRAHYGHTWTHERDWLTADIRDGMLALFTLTYNINRREGSPALPRPEPAPRPEQHRDDDADEEREAYVVQVRAEMDVTRRRIFGKE